MSWHRSPMTINVFSLNFLLTFYLPTQSDISKDEIGRVYFRYIHCKKLLKTYIYIGFYSRYIVSQGHFLVERKNYNLIKYVLPTTCCMSLYFIFNMFSIKNYYYFHNLSFKYLLRSIYKKPRYHIIYIFLDT